MTLGDDAYDRLAAALADTDFDAVERDGLRATWTGDDTEVTVEAIDDGGETVVYNADDLVRATSDRELNDAREPE